MSTNRLPDLADGPEAGRKVVKARHPEYQEFEVIWRWLQDSLEGGERYREADYGSQSYVVRWMDTNTTTGERYPRDRAHKIPRRNLIRHPGEYPQPPGPNGLPDWAEGAPSTGDEYELRRALTPVPGFVAEAVETHLSKIYAKEVRREFPKTPLGERLAAWARDVDGCGTTIDEWVREEVAPLFSTLGQLDFRFDHPRAPAGQDVATAADAQRLGLDRCVASYVLPENLTDWSLDASKRYARAVVREWSAGGKEQFREWTPEGWTLYDDEGRRLDEGSHPYGRTPVVRAFDVRKTRCGNVGQSRYDTIAQIMRSYYNVDSELTLANSLASQPVLSGPEDYCNGTGIQMGPSNVLPMKRIPDGSYQGWAYVCAPSEASERLAAKLRQLRDDADRAACLTKPAGASGTAGNTVSQSGLSKQMDAATGNDLLAKLSHSLEGMEWLLLEGAATCLNDGPLPPGFLDTVTISYPTEFNLYSAADFAALFAELQALAASVDGALPKLTGHCLRTYARLMLPGLDDKTYAETDEEIESFIEAREADAEKRAEAGPLPPLPPNASLATAAGASPAEPLPDA
jgi:hypothetical protein